MNDLRLGIMGKQFKSPTLIMGQRIFYSFLLSLILTIVHCVPAISFKKIIWEEIDINRTPTREDHPNANAVFLLDEGEFSVTKHRVFTRHTMIKILDEAGLKYANVEIPFYWGAEVHNIKGRTIQKDGTIVTLQPEDIYEKSLFPKYVLYADSKAKVLALPGAEIGSLVEYSYSVLYKAPFPTAWEFQRSEPVLRSTFTLDIPAFLKYYYLLSKRKEMEVEESISRSPGRVKAVFEVRNAPAITYEPFMPSLSEVTTKIYFSLSSLSMFGISLPVEGDSWDILGHNYWLSVKDKIEADEVIKSQVQEIVDGSTTELEKIGDIYDFVQSNIRYVAVGTKEGRVIPHNPLEVFTNKYGDCKDKVFLFITMLKEAGIDALPVLTRTSNSGEVIENFVSAQQFNHMVAAVPAQYFTDFEGFEEVVVRGDKEYTLSDDYIVLDATSRAIPFGQIPWSLENTRALFIKEEGSELMTIPRSSADVNRTTRVCEVDIQEDGTFLCSVQSTKIGQEANTTRSFLQPLSEAEQKEWFENTLSYSCPGAIVEEYSISGLFEPTKLPIVDYKLRIPKHAHMIETFLTFTPSILRNPIVDKLTRQSREYCICFDYCKVLIDVVNIEIPEDLDVKTVPDAISRSSTFGDYSFLCFTDGDKVVLNKQLSIRETEIPKESYAQVKSFFESVLISEKENIIFHQKP